MASAGEVVRGLFTQQPLTKGVALLTALALWWYVGYELSATHTFSVRVTVSLAEGQRKEWRLLSESEQAVQTVRVDVEGPRQLIEQLGDEETPFTGKVSIGEAELVGLMGEEATVPVTLRGETHFYLPNRRLRVVRIDPAAITVRLGRMREETLIIELDELAKRMRATDLGEFTVTDVTASALQVKVVGPVSALARRKTVPLEPPDVAGQQRNVTVLAELARSVVRDEHIDFVPGARRPTLTVHVAAKPVRKKFDAELIWDRSDPPEGFQIQDGLAPTFEVMVKGPKEYIERLTAESIRVLARMPDVLQGEAGRPNANAAKLEISIYPAESWPGVTVVDPPRDISFDVIPKPRAVSPPGPGGAGEAPPGGGSGPGGNGKSGGGGTQGRDAGGR